MRLELFPGWGLAWVGIGGGGGERGGRGGGPGGKLVRRPVDEGASEGVETLHELVDSRARHVERLLGVLHCVAEGWVWWRVEVW